MCANNNVTELSYSVVLYRYSGTSCIVSELLSFMFYYWSPGLTYIVLVEMIQFNEMTLTSDTPFNLVDALRL